MSRAGVRAGSRAAVRTGTVVVATAVLVPLLALYAYLLAWFLPELTGGGRPALWLGVFAVTATAAGSLVVGWFRRHRPDWWLWPLAAALWTAVSWPLAALF